MKYSISRDPFKSLTLAREEKGRNYLLTLQSVSDVWRETGADAVGSLPVCASPHTLQCTLAGSAVPAPAVLCLKAFSSQQSLLCPPVQHSGYVWVLTSPGSSLQPVNERNWCINTLATLSLG